MSKSFSALEIMDKLSKEVKEDESGLSYIYQVKGRLQRNILKHIDAQEYTLVAACRRELAQWIILERRARKEVKE